MCGIAGYFGNRSIAPDQIDHILNSMSHRGPDGHGVYHRETKSRKHMYFFHTRLAIIDLDPRSNQPMQIGKNVICFNGEIYNYKECRAFLSQRFGEKFSTDSDTEVLLKMLIHLETNEALKQMEGMWAFGHFDESTDTLTLSRDRFGEKPLYYFQDDTGFYFASELPILFSIMGKRPDIDSNKLRSYLFLGYRNLHRENTTFYSDVRLLKSHHLLKVMDGKVTDLSSYWNVSKVQVSKFESTEIAISEVKDKLFRSIELRLRSDVPIAFCMSGGIDSLTLISIAKKIFGYDVHGFTIDNQDERYNEAKFVDDAVQSLQIRHSYVKPGEQNFISNLTDLVASRTCPISTISYYVHSLLMKKIAENGYKVSISGTGADELFTGYYDHFLYHIALQKDDSAVITNWKNHVLPVVKNPFFQDPFQFVKYPKQRKYLYEDYLLHGDSFQPPTDTHYSANILRNRMLNELLEEVVPVILLEDDHNSMKVSIENRSPFLDTDLLSTSLRIPEKLLIQDGYGKYILREVGKGIVPELARTHRQKTGFNASLFELLPSDFLSEFDSSFNASHPIFSYVDRDYVRNLFSRNKDNEKFLFNFLCAKIFLDLHYH